VVSFGAAGIVIRKFFRHQLTIQPLPTSDRTKIVLTSRPDDYLGPGDIVLALSRRIRVSVVGAPPPPPAKDPASLVQIARVERAARVDGRAVLIVDVMGDKDIPNRSPNTPLDDIVFTVVDKQVVKEISKLHEKLIGQALASLALLAAPVYGLKKLSDFVLLDPAAPSPVHVSPASIDIKIGFRTSMPTGLKDSIESHFAELFGTPDLERVMRLYGDSCGARDRSVNSRAPTLDQYYTLVQWFIRKQLGNITALTLKT
jgi:hypothetical protein